MNTIIQNVISEINCTDMSYNWNLFNKNNEDAYVNFSDLESRDSSFWLFDIISNMLNVKLFVTILVKIQCTFYISKK